MLSGKVAIVTGATSGIGKATAIKFATSGAKVFITGRDEARAKACLKAIESAGGEAQLLLGDVSKSHFCDDIVNRAVEHFGRLDILANVAGVIRRGDALATSDEDWRYTMAANVDGVFFMSRAAVSTMAKGGGGSVINLGSTVGLVGCEALPAYCASKGAVIQLTRAMALDHAKQNIRINAVCPGAIDTPMLVSGHDDSVTPQVVHENSVASIPQGRIPSPDEVAELICFLASDASAHITGTAIPIDGGYTAQ